MRLRAVWGGLLLGAAVQAAHALDVRGGPPGARRVLREIEAHYDDRRWDPFLKESLKLLEQAQPDFVVFVEKGYGLGIREWVRTRLLQAPPEVLTRYQEEVSRLAKAEGHEAKSLAWAARFPESREERHWRTQARLSDRDAGRIGWPAPVPPRTDSLAVTLSWSSSTFTLSPTALTGARAFPPELSVTEEIVTLLYGGSASQWKIADGRRLGLSLPPPGSTASLLRTAADSHGQSLFWLSRQEIQRVVPSPARVTLAHPLEGFAALQADEGFVMSRGPLKQPGGSNLLSRWVSRVRWEKAWEVEWETPLMVNPMAAGSITGLVEGLTEEDAAAVFGIMVMIDQEEAVLREELKNPERRKEILAERQKDTAEELFADYQELRNVLSSITGPLWQWPVLLASERGLMVGLPQGLVASLESREGCVQWIRVIPPWEHFVPLPIAQDDRRVYMVHAGKPAETIALSADTGGRVWSRPSEATLTMAGSDAHAVVVAEGPRLLGLSPATGQVRWKLEGPAEWNGRGCVADGVAWMPMGKRLIGVETESGRLISDLPREDGSPGTVAARSDYLVDATLSRCSVHRITRAP